MDTIIKLYNKQFYSSGKKRKKKGLNPKRQPLKQKRKMQNNQLVDHNY